MFKFCVIMIFVSPILAAHAWNKLPDVHLECDNGVGKAGNNVDVNCRLVPGPSPDLGFKLEPSDPKEVMSITKDITGRMTLERRDGSHETFRPDGMGGWQNE